MSNPREIEIKLDVEQAGKGALQSRLEARLGKGRTERLVSVYFDSAKQVLRKNGLTLRIRTVGDRHVQTVKGGGAAGSGLFQRAEWETDIDGDQPDLGVLKETPVVGVLAAHGAVLLPLFETAIERTTWLVERGGSRVEVALDDGRAIAGDRSTPIVELELELKEGEPEELFVILRAISAGTALRPGVLAKSDRGYALVRDKAPRAAKAEPVPLEPGMTTAAAFQAIMRACIRQFRLNEPLVVATRGVEALHQARVGMRRLRSALSLFKRITADEEIGDLKTRLRAVSRQLGEARDLDVYLGHALAQEEEPGTAAYKAEIERRREEAYDRVIAAFASAEFRRLMLELMMWVEAGPWRSSDDPLRRAGREQPIEEVAAAVLDKRRRTVKRKGRHLDTLDPRSRHRVRIAAKKLRYAAEFVAGLPRHKKERVRHAGFIEVMEGLQKTLGDLNDIETGHTLAFGYAQRPHNTPAALAAGHVSGGQDKQKAGLLQAAVEGHRAFKDAKPFWWRWSASS